MLKPQILENPRSAMHVVDDSERGIGQRRYTLVSRGSHSRACCTCLFVLKQMGATPLHSAAWLGLPDIVSQLAESGADFSTQDQVREPVRHALRYTHTHPSFLLSSLPRGMSLLARLLKRMSLPLQLAPALAACWCVWFPCPCRCSSLPH